MIADKTHFKQLKKDEKIAFIVILCALSAIDGKIRPEETDFINDIAQTMNEEVKPDYFRKSQKFCLSMASKIRNRLFALELLKNMFALAYTDNEFTDSEGQFICTIAEAMNIPPTKVSEISSWIVDRIIWLEQANLIFNETPTK